MQSKAASVQEYLASLPEDRRAAISAVRGVINRNLGAGYEERMSYGMIGWCVPHSVYPAGYHCDPEQPLPFAGLASQKQYMSIYLPIGYYGCIEGEDPEPARWFREAWTSTGRKLDMGKVCVRFKRIEDVALEVVGEAVRRLPCEAYIRAYEASLGAMGRAPKKAAAAGAKAAPAKRGVKEATVKKAGSKNAGGTKVAPRKTAHAKVAGAGATRPAKARASRE